MIRPSEDEPCATVRLFPCDLEVNLLKSEQPLCLQWYDWTSSLTICVCLLSIENCMNAFDALLGARKA